MLHNKFWQGFFAIAPIVSLLLIFVGYFVFIFALISEIPELKQDNNVPPVEILQGMGFFFILLLLTIFISISSLVFYIVHAVQNPNLKENNMLVVWILLFLFVGGIGKLIYWIVEIIGKRNTLPANS
jgi:hypothetical protein